MSYAFCKENSVSNIGGLPVCNLLFFITEGHVNPKKPRVLKDLYSPGGGLSGPPYKSQ